MQFPATNPIDDPTALWAVQLELLGHAETLLGPRDQSKKVYQPLFTDHGPNLRNTPDLDGAFVELSAYPNKSAALRAMRAQAK